jgi:hypothetical protein
MSETEVGEVCVACGHDIHMHFEDVTKHVQCLIRTRHRTTSGVTGLEYDVACECEDYAIPPAGSPKRDERMKRIVDLLQRAAEGKEAGNAS